MMRYRVHKMDVYQPHPWVFESRAADDPGDQGDYGSVATFAQAISAAAILAANDGQWPIVASPMAVAP